MGLWVFFLRSLLFATSFFLSISEKCSYISDCSCSLKLVIVELSLRYEKLRKNILGNHPLKVANSFGKQ